MKSTIQRIFLEVFQREAKGKALPVITDDLILLESGLDSLGFAILVVELEEQLGFDPFSIADEAFYPQTFGEFVEFYEKHQP
ncbi:acyl carrier protein [Halomonas sp. ISL-60]|uniref:acyl carrier protein n=1 Tax=Halomonas sp. ISL-56 TaxID=2819149 RepID=UPI001BEA75F4|nr:acyl carrier protein [Halomonas sp. ISL-60]MBT2803367.1 acyl carrier protein [Halomonas sp. ISL-56]